MLSQPSCWQDPETWQTLYCPPPEGGQPGGPLRRQLRLSSCGHFHIPNQEMWAGHSSTADNSRLGPGAFGVSSRGTRCWAEGECARDAGRDAPGEESPRCSGTTLRHHIFAGRNLTLPCCLASGGAEDSSTELGLVGHQEDSNRRQLTACVLGHGWVPGLTAVILAKANLTH